MVAVSGAVYNFMYGHPYGIGFESAASGLWESLPGPGRYFLLAKARPPHPDRKKLR